MIAAVPSQGKVRFIIYPGQLVSAATDYLHAAAHHQGRTAQSVPDSLQPERA